MKWKFFIGTILIASISGFLLILNYTFTNPDTGRVMGVTDYQLNNTTQITKNLSAREVRRLIYDNSQNSDFIVLDIRTAEERSSQGYIENSVNIDYYNLNFKNNIKKLDKQKTYLIYCQSGNRSSLTSEIMEEQGFKNIYNMSGGILAWQFEGFDLEK
jgi:rhodanese-related sulfurtransferase